MQNAQNQLAGRPKPVRPPPEDFLPLTSVAYSILLVLWDGDQGGDGILHAVRADLKSRTSLRRTALQRTLERLRETGLIEVLAARTDPPRPPIYRLTSLGNRVLRAEAERLLQMTQT
jgi:DNA-binding HxlR family transcriptional regulator